MGLCKCPKRQVTNQFCFEHRVNVCENCMVASHPKCIVQSYLQWLKDSDYNSNCTLCGNLLESEDCIRLNCFHVFHWSCINARQSSLPSNTAPGGHQCPTCSHHIFPPANLVSPVADVLRSRLSQVNWGRNELGLPLFSEELKESKSLPPGSYASNQTVSFHPKKINGAVFVDENIEAQSRSHSVLHMDPFIPNSNSRRSLLSREPPIGSDRDDNKYKRRTPSEIFSRWSRRLYSPTSRPIWRRTWFLIFFGLMFFTIFIYIIAQYGRNVANSDPMLNIQNPNNNHNEE